MYQEASLTEYGTSSVMPGNHFFAKFREKKVTQVRMTGELIIKEESTWMSFKDIEGREKNSAEAINRIKTNGMPFGKSSA